MLPHLIITPLSLDDIRLVLVVGWAVALTALFSKDINSQMWSSLTLIQYFLEG